LSLTVQSLDSVQRSVQRSTQKTIAQSGDCSGAATATAGATPAAVPGNLWVAGGTPRRGTDIPDRPSSSASARHAGAQARSLGGAGMASVLGGRDGAAQAAPSPRSGLRLRQERPLTAKIGSGGDGGNGGGNSGGGDGDGGGSRVSRPVTDAIGAGGRGAVEFGHRAAFLQRPGSAHSARSTRPW
jgi:hypothetical protein